MNIRMEVCQVSVDYKVLSLSNFGDRSAKWYNRGKMSMNIPIDPGELYETRLLVFLETKPQSNEYKQIIFNPLEFQKVSFAIGGNVPDGKVQNVQIRTSDMTYKLPDLQSFDHRIKVDAVQK